MPQHTKNKHKSPASKVKKANKSRSRSKSKTKAANHKSIYPVVPSSISTVNNNIKTEKKPFDILKLHSGSDL